MAGLPHPESAEKWGSARLPEGHGRGKIAEKDRQIHPRVFALATAKSDNAHFNAKALREFGKRYAEVYASVSATAAGKSK